MPTEPNEIDPGFALASAMKSWTVFHGRDSGHDHHIGAGADHQHRGKILGGIEGQVGKIAGAIVSAEEWARML